MIFDKNEPLWVERYRPRTIDDCILAKSIKNIFNEIKKSGHIPNMILSGRAGTGKTTVAKALCSEMGMDWLIINASEDNGIDVVRTRIRNFASTVSMGDGGHKVVILDEADYMNPNSAQPALRNFIEEFSQTCSFIFTCNFPNRIIEPLHSRCNVIDFAIDKKEKNSMMKSFMGRVQDILKNENVEYEPRAVATLINKYFPDNRKILGEFQKFSRGGSIDAGCLANVKDTDFATLITALKAKEFGDVRQWVSDNADSDTSLIYRKIYDNLNVALLPNSIPEVIMILAEAQKWDSTVADIELHLTAMFVEILSCATFK